MKHSPDDATAHVGGFGPRTAPPRGFCYFCSATGLVAPRRLRSDHDEYPGCVDHEACDGRVRARCCASSFAASEGRKTPPGVALVAVIVAAERPVPCGDARGAVDWMRRYADDAAHARDYASDLVHARASGIIAHDLSAETLSPGPRFEAIAASVRASALHVDAARAALVCVGFLSPEKRGHFLNHRYGRAAPASSSGAAPPRAPLPLTPGVSAAREPGGENR